MTIDPWDIANIFNPLAHLVYRPAVGTVVEGLPSGAYWEFGPKNRYLVPPDRRAPCASTTAAWCRSRRSRAGSRA